MNNTSSIVNQELSENGTSYVNSIIKKHTKRINSIKIVAIVLAVLFISSFFIQVDKWNYISTPIEYTELTTDSKTGSYCYVDSIVEYVEVFEIESNAPSSISGTTATGTYFLVSNKDGFVFLICQDEMTSFFERAMTSDNTTQRFYGQVESLPVGLKMDYSTLFSDPEFFSKPGSYDDIKEALAENKEDFYDTFGQFKILKVYEDYPTEDVRKGGENIWFNVLTYSRIIIVIGIIILIRLILLQKKKLIHVLHAEAERISMKTREN